LAALPAESREVSIWGLYLFAFSDSDPQGIGQSGEKLDYEAGVHMTTGNTLLMLGVSKGMMCRCVRAEHPFDC
jgi:hypothetical protein